MMRVYHSRAPEKQKFKLLIQLPKIRCFDEIMSILASIAHLNSTLITFAAPLHLIQCIKFRMPRHSISLPQADCSFCTPWDAVLQMDIPALDGSRSPRSRRVPMYICAQPRATPHGMTKILSLRTLLWTHAFYWRHTTHSMPWKQVWQVLTPSHHSIQGCTRTLGYAEYDPQAADMAHYSIALQA